MDDYRLVRTLGEGTFGQVYEAQHKHTQQTVAIKVVQLAETDDSTASNAELRALQLCRHPNVVQLHAHFVHRHALALVLHHMHCDLAQLLQCCQRTATPLPLSTTRLLAHQLLTGLAHLHSCGVLHRDIKPSNLLLAAGSEQRCLSLQLADFGQASVSASTDRPLSAAAGTRWYKAPELLLPSDGTGGPMYGSGVDVWAAGCVLAECVSGAVLLAGNSDVEQLSRIAAMCGRHGGEHGWQLLDEGKGPAALLSEGEEEAREGEVDMAAAMRRDVLQLLDSMLQWDPARRSTARQALNHPFFTRTAMTTEQTDMRALLRWFDQRQANISLSSKSTSELLKQSFTTRDALSHDRSHLSSRCSVSV